MPRGKLSGIVKPYMEAMRRGGSEGLPMRVRLFIFLILFLVAIMLGVLVILFSVGVFRAGETAHLSILEGELAHLAGDVYKTYGTISVHAVDLAKDLSTSIERNMKEHGVSADMLQENPELLEHLLDEELSRLTGTLERSRGSGAFIMLDATVNPSLPEASDSRACIYLKNMEPNIVSGMEANLRLALCPMPIARNNRIRILPQWQMELSLQQIPFMSDVMEVARENTLPASRLYSWDYGIVLPQSSERVMLCTVPLVAADGTVFGTCGIEVSEMLFKLSYSPEASGYDRLFCMLSPIEGDTLRISRALFAGDFIPGPTAPQCTEMKVSSGSGLNPGKFYSYSQQGKDGYAGLHKAVSIYPSNSAYAGNEWAVVLLMPKEVLDSLISSKNSSLIVSMLGLMIVTIALASFISNRYISPVTEALELLKKPVSAAKTKTKIPEIDDLIEFLAAQDEVSNTQEHSVLFQEFVKNIKTLSAAEKAVFDLYTQGHTAQEIAEILCLSINTIKTHNRRIYMKLNVTSRKELMVYIQLLRGDGYLV